MIPNAEAKTAGPGPDRPARGARIFWFDAVRGVSALAVCAGHLRAAVLCDFDAIEDGAAWHAPFYFATGLGHQAVMVFFVLSGYFVGGSVLRDRRRFDWSKYSVARLSRLWTVLIPALLFTAAADAATGALAPEVFAGDYRADWRSGPDGATARWGPVTLLRNVFFLQTVAGPVYGTNGPLWSLANEFWYYLLFPLLVAAAVARPRGRALAPLAGAALIALALPRAILLAGPIWLLGAGVSLLGDRDGPWRRVTPAVSLPLGCLAFGGALAASKSPLLAFAPPSSLASDLLVGVTFAAVALLVVRGQAPPVGALGRPTRLLSDISYSLYLFHFPIVVLIGGAVLGGRQYQPTGRSLLLYFSLLAALVAAGGAA